MEKEPSEADEYELVEGGHEGEITTSYGSDTRFGSYVEGNVLHLSGVGYLDLYTMPHFNELVRHQLEQERPQPITHAEVDLTKALYLDSTALGCLIRLVKRLRKARPSSLDSTDVVVKVSDPNIRVMFEITLLNRILDIQFVEPDQP